MEALGKDFPDVGVDAEALVRGVEVAVVVVVVVVGYLRVGDYFQ